jgi:hypothetical protein
MNRQVHIWLLVVTGVFSSACHTMQPVSPSELTAGAIGAVWVTRSDRSMVVLQAPRVTGDTLAGFVDGAFREMPLSQATKLTVEKAARTRTLVLGVTTGVTLLGAFVYMANRSYVGDGQTCYTPKDGDVVPCCAGKSTLSC